MTPPLLWLGLAAAALSGSLVWALRQEETGLDPGSQVLGMVSTSRIQSLDPQGPVQPGVALLRTRLIQALREGLVEFDPRTQMPRPAGAERWEIAADNRSAVFHLRSGTRWSNGDALVAGDYVFAIRLALASHSLSSDTLSILRNARAFSEGRITDIKRVGVTALGPDTLRLDLESPVHGLLTELCDRAWLPLHPGSIAALHDGSYWQHPERLVTNGAFELAHATADEITLRPNRYYRDRAQVRLTEIAIRYTEQAALFPLLLRSDRAQLSDRLASGEIPSPLPGGVQLWGDPTLAVSFVHFNLRNSPLADRRVRQALSLALDRAKLARDVSTANVRPAFTCLPPVGDWEKMHTVDENLAEARRLLAAAGYPGGRGLPVLRWPFRSGGGDASVRLPEVCAEQWRERLGLQAYVLPLEGAEFQSRVASRDYDVVLAAFLGTLPDLAHLAGQLSGAELRSYSGWDGGTLPALVDVTREEGGALRRDEVLAVEQAFLAEMPATPLVFYNRHTLKSDSVAGWFPDSTGLHPLKYLYLTAPVRPAHDL